VIASAHVVLGAALPDGTPPLPETLGDARIWSAVYPLDIGNCPAWEYRDGADARFVVIQRVALLDSARAVWIAYVPALERGEVSPLLAMLADPLLAMGVLEAYWPVAADGTIAAVDAPEVLAAWPAAWRQHLPEDLPADGAESGAPLPPPTGARIIGATLA